jgi:hypothetical protein
MIGLGSSHLKHALRYFVSCVALEVLHQADATKEVPGESRYSAYTCTCQALWKEGTTLGVCPVFNWVGKSLGTWDSSSFYNILTPDRSPLLVWAWGPYNSIQLNTIRFNQSGTLSSSTVVSVLCVPRPALGTSTVPSC